MLGGTKLTLAEVLVIAVCELIAVPLCDASWHAIVGEHEVIRGIIGLAIGIPIGVAGISFHWWKDRLPTASGWLLRESNRWWPAVLLLALVYLIGPSVYRRAIGNNPSPIGKIVWNLEPAARGGGFFLGMFKNPNQEIRILGFQAHGKNVSKEPIGKLNGWIRSDITNSTKPIYLLGQDNDESLIAACIPRVPTPFDETYGIPAFADFDVVTFPQVSYSPKDGISVETFINAFAPFTAHIEYDGATAERQFSKEEIERQVDIFGKILSLQSVPRVIRKENATKPKYAPLQPLTNATPVPSLPQLRPITPEDQFDPSPTGTMVPRAK